MIKPIATTIWQIACSSWGRSYADVFLKHSVALIGPSEPGPWTSTSQSDIHDDAYVRRFASEVRVGDAVVLRTGVNRIVAIGLVAGDYEYLETFDDENGCDLQHARRVRWYPLPESWEPSAFVFGANPPRISRTKDPAVAEMVDRFLRSEPRDWQTRPLPPLPSPELRLESPPDALAEIVGQAIDLQQLYGDPEKFPLLPSEEELVTHLVIPLLRRLGWPPELIALQWNDIDVALFTRLPRSPDTCRLVIEAKRIGAIVEGALEQAKRYVAVLGVPCDIVVTDGIRYRYFDSSRAYEPVAYANLVSLKRSGLALFERIRNR